MNFSKRLANRWMARGFVTYGRAEWDIDDRYFQLNDPSPAQAGPDVDGGLYVGVESTAGGFLPPLQSDWMANLNGMYQVAPEQPWGFNISANLYAREGFPLPYARFVTGSDGINRAIAVTGEVDDFRTDDILTVDARIDKEFAASGNVGFTVSIDVFNLLDEDYVLERELDLGATTGNFLRKTLSPRVWRLGVRLSWR